MDSVVKIGIGSFVYNKRLSIKTVFAITDQYFNTNLIIKTD